jgi:hypothetical protein
LDLQIFKFSPYPIPVPKLPKPDSPELKTG